MKKKDKVSEAEATPAPAITIVATDTVKLNIPGRHSGYDGYYIQSVVPTLDDLRAFVRAVEDRFGSYTDAPLTVSQLGIAATETEDLGGV